jgi:transposase-like protein
VYRAIDERGRVVDVYVKDQRAAEDAAAFFRRAIEATGVIPEDVTTDCAAAYPVQMLLGKAARGFSRRQGWPLGNAARAPRPFRRGPS